jgi:hypothetical protein
MGRPRLKYIEYVEDDLRELKVKIWRKQESNREDWASVCEGDRGF